MWQLWSKRKAVSTKEIHRLYAAVIQKRKRLVPHTVVWNSRGEGIRKDLQGGDLELGLELVGGKYRSKGLVKETVKGKGRRLMGRMCYDQIKALRFYLFLGRANGESFGCCWVFWFF